MHEESPSVSFCPSALGFEQFVCLQRDEMSHELCCKTTRQRLNWVRLIVPAYPERSQGGESAPGGLLRARSLRPFSLRPRNEHSNNLFNTLLDLTSPRKSVQLNWSFDFFFCFQVTLLFLQWTKHNNFWGESESLNFYQIFLFRNMFKFQNLTAAETMSKIHRTNQ